MPHAEPETAIPRTFVDLFAGCGGFSVGFLQANWKGLFGIEKHPSPFATLSHNLLDASKSHRYDWPEWLDKEPWNVRALLREKRSELRALEGKVGAVIGGPPCQGFSFAGKRQRHDYRNKLLKVYAELVGTIQPYFAVVENVQGIAIAHGTKNWLANRRVGRPPKAFSDRLLEALAAVNYVPIEPPATVRSFEFGVPQYRPRFLLMAVRKDLLPLAEGLPTPLQLAQADRHEFLRRKGLTVTKPQTVANAISDLLRSHGTVECTDAASPRGFQSGLRGPAETDFQRLMRAGCDARSPDSHRFARHTEVVETRFATLQKRCRDGVYKPGCQLNEEAKKEFGLSKNVTVVLDGNLPSHTLTSLPDDLIHYHEPRIMTLREYARLQTFPDSFEFKGPYTTGGPRRKRQCPRYTQVANAVPPMLAEALALSLDAYATALESRLSALSESTATASRAAS